MIRIPHTFDITPGKGVELRYSMNAGRSLYDRKNFLPIRMQENIPFILRHLLILQNPVIGRATFGNYKAVTELNLLATPED